MFDRLKNFFKKKEIILTKEEEEERIMLRLMFPEAFQEANKIEFQHGLDIEGEILAICREEYKARMKDSKDD